jgi:phosphohistidine phosphatase
MPERTLILLRHTKSDWSGDQADIARPLANAADVRPRTRADGWPRTSTALTSLSCHPPGALAAPGTSSRRNSTSLPRTRIDDRVYAASDQQLLTLVRELPDDTETVVLVGHNPGIEDLASYLTGESAPMPTSALAVITLPSTWSTAGRDSAVLRASGRPPAQ